MMFAAFDFLPYLSVLYTSLSIQSLLLIVTNYKYTALKANSIMKRNIFLFTEANPPNKICFFKPKRIIKIMHNYSLYLILKYPLEYASVSHVEGFVKSTLQ